MIKEKIFSCFMWRYLSFRNRLLGAVLLTLIIILLSVTLTSPENFFSDEQRIDLHLFTATLLILFGWIFARFINRVDRKVQSISTWPFYHGRWKVVFELIKLLFYAPASVGVVWFLIMVYIMRTI